MSLQRTFGRSITPAELNNPEFGRRGNSLPIGTKFSLAKDENGNLRMHVESFKRQDGTDQQFPIFVGIVGSREVPVPLSNFCTKSVENTTDNGHDTVTAEGVCGEDADYTTIYAEVDARKDSTFEMAGKRYTYDSSFGGRRSAFCKAVRVVG